MKCRAGAGVLLCLLFVSLSAAGQATAPPAPPEGADQSAAGIRSPAPTPIPLPPVSKQISDVPRALKIIAQHQKGIKELLDDATAKQQVIRVDCIYDKWNQARGLGELAQAAKQSFAKAQRARQALDRQHFYRKVMRLQQKVAQLEEEARRCGQLRRGAKRTTIKVSESGGEGTDDSDDVLDSELPEIPPVSPFR